MDVFPQKGGVREVITCMTLSAPYLLQGLLKTGLTAGLLYWHKRKRDLQRSSCSLGLSEVKGL